MKCPSLKTRFPENFLAVLTLIQNIQTQLSKHSTVEHAFRDQGFQDEIGNLADELVKMTQKYEKACARMSVQTKTILREQIKLMHSYSVDIFNFFILETMFVPYKEPNFDQFKKNVADLLNFWEGHATTGIRCD